MELFDDFFKNTMPREEEDNKYTKKVETPIYSPSNRCPNIMELIDTSKFEQLKRKIQASGVSEQEKKFLLKCATRHLGFYYSKIADYYAHASKEMQELMEDSALVIIDFDKAIQKGYVKLNDKMRELYDKE